MKLIKLLTTTILCLIAVSVQAATVDQSQLTFNTGTPFVFPSGTTNYPLGQSFTAGLDGRLTQIDVFSNGQLNASNDVTLELRSGDGTGGVLLGTITQSVGPNTYDSILNGFTVSLNTTSLGIDVMAGSVYTFLFTNVTGPGDLAGRGILAENLNPYAPGRAYHGAGYGNTPTWDLMFQTHVVPIPAAVWLFGSGLIGLIGVARRKKA